MRILLIEDDKITSNIVTSVLQTSGMVCDVAESGSAGITACKINKYDAVLLDIILPDYGGLCVLKAIKEVNEHIPVLILSGLSSIKDKARCLNAGADDFMEKPVYKEELIARINAVSRRSNCTANPVIQVGRLNVDLSKRVVYNDLGVMLDLTEKEYRIIELMVRKRGSVIDKAHFISHLYNGGDQQEFKIIDVFMCKIRSKLSKLVGDWRDYIHTRWGRGYMLDYQTKVNSVEVAEKRVIS